MVTGLVMKSYVPFSSFIGAVKRINYPKTTMLEVLEWVFLLTAQLNPACQLSLLKLHAGDDAIKSLQSSLPAKVTPTYATWNIAQPSSV